MPRGRVFEAGRALGIAVAGPLHFSVRTGHARSSLARRSVDAHGEAIPWYTYPLVEMLRHRDFSDRRVLEFGGGQSTHWWSARASTVVTVEPDADWANELRQLVPSNVELHHVPVDRKSRDVSGLRSVLQAHADEGFDLVVIDGHLRPEATELAWPLLRPNGALIMDNSDSYGFQEFTERVDADRVDFYGYSAGNRKPGCSSVAWRDKCFLWGAGTPIRTWPST